jgi:hypothetical protein
MRDESGKWRDGLAAGATPQAPALRFSFRSALKLSVRPLNCGAGAAFPAGGASALITRAGGFILIISRSISSALRAGVDCGLVTVRVGFGTRLVLLVAALPAPVQSQINWADDANLE